MIPDLLLDINVVVDICARRHPYFVDAVKALDKAISAGVRLWIYAGSVQTLEYVTAIELRRIATIAGQVMSFGESHHKARQLLALFWRDKQCLAALAEDGDVWTAEDPEDARLCRAVQRLVKEARLLTRDDELLKGFPVAISPRAYLNLESDKSPLPFIDLARQQDHIRPNLERSMHRVLHHGQYIMGPEVRELENKLAAFVGVKHCISCSSGTDALLIALMALDIGPGDEVITVPCTWISTAEVISLLRAKPVFVDIQPDTFNMDPDLIEAAITPKTRVIMPVCLYGQCADMTRITAIAQKHGLPVIEDGAQSFGATHHGKKSCALSLIGCSSFYPSKPLGCYGDGGAVFTDDDGLAEKMRQIRVHGQKVKHQHPLVGINGRLDTLQAAILLEKFEIFPEECHLRREAGKRYDELLSSLPGIQTPVIAEGNDSVYAQYTILSEDRDALSQALKVAGIPSVAYYTVPLHLQGAFADLGHKPGDFPVAEKVAAQCLSLPMSPYLSPADQESIAMSVKKYFQGNQAGLTG